MNFPGWSSANVGTTIALGEGAVKSVTWFPNHAEFLAFQHARGMMTVEADGFSLLIHWGFHITWNFAVPNMDVIGGSVHRKEALSVQLQAGIYPTRRGRTNEFQVVIVWTGRLGSRFVTTALDVERILMQIQHAMLVVHPWEKLAVNSSSASDIAQAEVSEGTFWQIMTTELKVNAGRITSAFDGITETDLS